MITPETQAIAPVDPLSFDQFKPQRSQAGVITEDAHAPGADGGGAIVDAPKDGTPQAGAADAPAADDLTPEEKALAGVEDESAKPVEYSEDLRKALKELTGFDDPEKFKSEWTSEREAARLTAEESKPLRDLKARLDKLSPQFRKGLEAEMRKAGDGHRMLREGPDPEVLSKDPKRLSDKQVLEYVDNHGITEEDWATINDPDADPGVRDAIKKRISFLRQNGEDAIRNLQEAAKADMEAEQAAMATSQERWNKGIAAAIAKAKEGPMKSFVTAQHIEEVRSGRFISRFFEDDGVTPKPELLETIIKAEKYESAREAARKYGEKKGYERGLAEQTSGMPSAPRAPRTVAQPKTGGKNPWVSTLDAIEASIT